MISSPAPITAPERGPAPPQAETTHETHFSLTAPLRTTPNTVFATHPTGKKAKPSFLGPVRAKRGRWNPTKDSEKPGGVKTEPGPDVWPAGMQGLDENGGVIEPVNPNAKKGSTVPSLSRFRW
jgi:hypothetical protein